MPAECGDYVVSLRDRSGVERRKCMLCGYERNVIDVCLPGWDKAAREDLLSLVREHHGRVHRQWNPKVTHLIPGPRANPATIGKAKTQGVRIMTSDQLRQMLLGTPNLRCQNNGAEASPAPEAGRSLEAVLRNRAATAPLPAAPRGEAPLRMRALRQWAGAILLLALAGVSVLFSARTLAQYSPSGTWLHRAFVASRMDPPEPIITRAEFDQLNAGQTYEEVIGIIGSECSDAGIGMIPQWGGPMDTVLSAPDFDPGSKQMAWIKRADFSGAVLSFSGDTLAAKYPVRLPPE